MIRALIITLFCALAVQLKAQLPDCGKFKTGYFENLDASGNNTYIKRTKNFQYEWDKMLGTKVTLKIKWIDNCTYKLKLVGGNAQWKKGEHSLDKFELTVQITETGNDYYRLSARMDGAGTREYTSKIIKIKTW